MNGVEKVENGILGTENKVEKLVQTVTDHGKMLKHEWKRKNIQNTI
jgi:hypothetical protein